MIVQIRYDVHGATAADMEAEALLMLSDFVDDTTKYRTAVEVHVGPDDKWIGHVTARPKRKRMDDDDDFGW